MANFGSYLGIAILLLLPPGAAGADSNLVFTDAYVAAAPPGAAAMAAYMTIENPDAAARSITAISSVDFAEVQMHRSIVKQGVAGMQQLERLTIEAGSRLELEPGAIHLMLLDPVHDFEPGDVILLELKEADGTLHRLGLKVHRTAEAPKAHHH